MKGLWIKRICGIAVAIVLVAALSGCFDSRPTVSVTTVSPPNVETPYYSLTSVNGEAYLIMKNIDTEENEEDGLGGVILLPTLDFSSVAEMRKSFLTGDFTEEELYKIKSQVQDLGKVDETGKLKIPNLNRLMDLDWPYGDVVAVSMLGEEYTLDFNGKNIYNGYLKILPESAWREELEEKFASVTETSESKTVEVNRIQDRNAKEYILSIDENTNFYRKIKHLVYTQTTQYGKYVIFEWFWLVDSYHSCSDTVPYSYMVFFQSNDGCFACVTLNGPKERLSLDELCSIQLKPLDVSLSDAETFR